MKRKDFFKYLTLGTAGLVAGTSIGYKLPNNKNYSAKNQVNNSISLRIAFITDMHISPEIPRSITVLEKIIKTLNNSKLPLDFIINGGDTVYDVFFENREKAEKQWDAVLKIFDKSTVPIYHVIGNHDIWAWGDKDILPSEDGYGKAMPLSKLNMLNPYYTFDKGNWKFIVLDNCQKDKQSYIVAIDKEQIYWLEHQISVCKQENICIISHAPLFSACYQVFQITLNNGKLLQLPAKLLVNKDFKKINSLINNPKLKLCLSGHLHMNEDINYSKTRYISCNALSGAKWKGSFLGFPPAYFLIDFYSNGSISYKVKYI
ncbi:MAG: metallophosphoesterase family protein [Tenacibaculum sp.]